MNKRNRLIALLYLFLAAPATAQQKPNIIFILADDLGYASIGAFGQQMIKTPNLDRLAQRGMVLTDFYANPICAPTRGSFITGLSTARSMVRDNYELGGFEDSVEFGQMPLPANTMTIGNVLRSAGYTTAVFGKWGLGGPGSSGVPWKQGFDFFYGYLDQKQAHNYYPTHLWRNAVWEPLPNGYFSSHQHLGDKDPNDPASYAAYKGKVYSCDTVTSEALKFIRNNRHKPFFMYMAYTLPHAALQVPDRYVQPYLGRFEEKPYTGGYLPNRTPNATYAAMITALDDYVGKILKQLQDLQLDKNTLVIFTADNGAGEGGANPDFFKCTGNLRGRKGSLYEGGIREPFIACWPGKIQPGSRSSHIGAIWDMLPTFAEAAGVKKVAGIDGISMMPVLLGKKPVATHPYLYWEIHGMRGMQAVRFGRWKAVRRGIHAKSPGPVELYDLTADIAEQNNIAAQHPEETEQAMQYLRARELAVLTEWNFYHPAARSSSNKAESLHTIRIDHPNELKDFFRYNEARIPLVSSHRGGPRKGFPENCIATFNNTLRHTWSILEIDPHYTKDSAIVLMHDPTLNRTTTGTGKVSEYTLEELRKLALKDTEGNATSYTIPTLDEALEWAKGKTILVIDQKDVPIEARVKKIQEHKAQSHAMVIAYSLEDARKCYALDKSIMMELMMPDKESMARFDATGVPWSNIVAFVTHTQPADKSIYSRIHEKGTMCIVGSSRTIDRQYMRAGPADTAALPEKYQALVREGADIIEADLGIEAGTAIQALAPGNSNKRKYFTILP